MFSNDDRQTSQVHGELEALRRELATISRQQHHGRSERSEDTQLDVLRYELQRLRYELSRARADGECAGEPPHATCAAPAPPYPPFPPFPPCPPFPPFPPYPPYPAGQGCCAPRPCGCSKCGHRAKAMPAIEAVVEQAADTPSSSSSSIRPGSSSSIGSSSRGRIGGIRIVPFSSSSTSVFSTNVK